MRNKTVRLLLHLSESNKFQISDDVNWLGIQQHATLGLSVTGNVVNVLGFTFSPAPVYHCPLEIRIVLPNRSTCVRYS